MIFIILLPTLLFEAAWNISFNEMKKWWRVIGSSAFLVVLFLVLAVAVLTNYFIPVSHWHLAWGVAFHLHAVSTGSITRFVKSLKSAVTVLCFLPNTIFRMVVAGANHLLAPGYGYEHSICFEQANV